MHALLALSLLALGQVVIPVPTPGPDQFALHADHGTWDGKTDRWVGDGHAELRGQELDIHAEHIDYDRREGRIVAKNALAVLGLTTAFADQVTVDLVSQTARVDHGLFLQKRRVLPEALMRLDTRDALQAAGQNALALNVQTLHRLSDTEVEVDGLSFTPCDCDVLNPSWHIDSSHANIREGERALLWWPVIYVGKVPVLALPALYLPLSDRRTGLLVTKPSHTALNGWTVEQPVFFTLGQSYDLTETPGYFFGEDNTRLPDGSYLADSGSGIRGPRLVSDFRYVPSTRTKGEVSLTLIDDLKLDRNPLTGADLLGTRRGLREELFALHQQDLGHGFSDRIDLSLASDGFLPVRDLTSDVIASTQQYLRSTAVLDHRADDHFFGAELGFLQDLRFGFNPVGTNKVDDPSSPYNGISGPRTLQRLPELIAGFPAQPLGPVEGELELRFTRFSPLVGRFGDEGVDGIYTGTVDTGQGDGKFEPGEREARSRFDLSPRLSKSFGLGRYATFTPYLGARADAYESELTGSSSVRGYGYFGFDLQSQIAGRLGDFTHLIVPSVSFLAGPGIWGDTPTPYDAIDQAFAGKGLTQARVQISQRLYRSGGINAVDLVRLDLGQELDFRQPQKARDAYARTQLSLGPAIASAMVRYDTVGKRIGELNASAWIPVGRRLVVSASYDDLLVQGSDRTRQGLDTLVGNPYLPGSTLAAQQLGLSARLNLVYGLVLGYDALLYPGSTPPGPNAVTSIFGQQIFSLGFAPACECWRFDLAFRVLPDSHGAFGQPEFVANLTISHFGSIGSGP